MFNRGEGLCPLLSIKEVMNIPLDIYDDMPKAMKRYLSHYGWHFNKAACMDAVSRMYKRNTLGKKVRTQFKGKKEVDELLKKHNVTLDNRNLYDYVYAYHMVMTDMMGISVDDEKHVMLMIKAIVDDDDNPGGNVFRHWYWDMIDKGEGIEFEDYLGDDEEE